MNQATLHDLWRPLGSTGLHVSPLGLGTVKLGRELVISGPLPVPDQKFRVPCSMRDTGRTIAAVADVVGGQMTITVTLPELGYWETTAEMLNAGLPQPTFSLADPIRFVVIP